MRHDRRRKRQTRMVIGKLKQIVKAARRAPTAKTLAQAYQALDKAAKRRIIHSNKASRLKSRLAKLLKK